MNMPEKEIIEITGKKYAYAAELADSGLWRTDAGEIVKISDMRTIEITNALSWAIRKSEFSGLYDKHIMLFKNELQKRGVSGGAWNI